MATEFAWLIEIPGDPKPPIYWDGTGNDTFMPDFMRAIRFARKLDAQRVLDHLITEEIRPYARVSEHGWSDD